MAGIVDTERYVIDMSLSGKNAHLSTRLVTERLSMTGLIPRLNFDFLTSVWSQLLGNKASTIKSWKFSGPGASPGATEFSWLYCWSIMRTNLEVISSRGNLRILSCEGWVSLVMNFSYKIFSQSDSQLWALLITSLVLSQCWTIFLINVWFASSNVWLKLKINIVFFFTPYLELCRAEFWWYWGHSVQEFLLCRGVCLQHSHHVCQHRTQDRLVFLCIHLSCYGQYLCQPFCNLQEE